MNHQSLSSLSPLNEDLLVLLNRLHGGSRRDEIIGQDHCAAKMSHDERPHDAPECMVQWIGETQYLVSGIIQTFVQAAAKCQRIIDDVVMCQCGAFWRSGRPLQSQSINHQHN